VREGASAAVIRRAQLAHLGSPRRLLPVDRRLVGEKRLVARLATEGIMRLDRMNRVRLNLVVLLY